MPKLTTAVYSEHERNKDSSLLECNAVSLDEWFQLFWRTMLPCDPSRSFLLVCLTHEDEETIHPETEFHIPEHLNPQQQWCENLVSHNNPRNAINKLFCRLCVMLLNVTSIFVTPQCPRSASCELVFDGTAILALCLCLCERQRERRDTSHVCAAIMYMYGGANLKSIFKLCAVFSHPCIACKHVKSRVQSLLSGICIHVNFQARPFTCEYTTLT